MYKIVLIPILVFYATLSGFTQNNFPGENVYWPGNFEQSLYGGNFSRARGVEISEEENHTPGGKKSWILKPNNYQHLELLTEGKGKFLVRFYAKALADLSVVVKKVVKTGEKEHITEDYEIVLKSDGNWYFYELELDVQQPYPGPRTGEILITCFNGSSADAWIDDVEIRRNSEDLEIDFDGINKKLKVDVLVNPDFQSGTKAWMNGDSQKKADDNTIYGSSNKMLKLGMKGVNNSNSMVYQVFDGSKLAGKKIRITLDAGFLAINEPAKSWSFILVNLKNGAEASAASIEHSPKPHWCALGLAPKPGTTKKIYSAYQIPDNVENLRIELSANNGMGNNIGVVDNIVFEVLPE